jgi:hypothetical protein
VRGEDRDRCGLGGVGRTGHDRLDRQRGHRSDTGSSTIPVLPGAPLFLVADTGIHDHFVINTYGH